MRILTKDNRLLQLLRIGDPDKDGCANLYCETEEGKKVTVTWNDIQLSFGSYTFFNPTKRGCSEKL